MSFVQINESTGTVYAPGYFLAHEECTRVTKTIKADDKSVKTASNGGKYVPMGTTYKEGTGESAKVIGVLYEDVDVTYGDMPGSVVTAGTIYKDRLATPDDADALKAIGFTVIESSDEVTRPE